MPYTVVEPPTSSFQAAGEAPLLAVVRIDDGVMRVPAVGEVNVSAAFDWGDGSPQEPVVATPCGDGTANWPGQTFRHTFTVPRPEPYSVIIRMVLSGSALPSGTQSFPLPVMFVTVRPASAASTATPPPGTAVPPGATATSSVAAPAAEATPELTPPAGPTAATAAASQSPAPTQTGTATPQPASTTPTASVAAGSNSTTPVPPPAAALEVVASLEAPDEISTDPAVVATNLVLAGVTVWVLFSSVMLNQVLQGNRSEIDQRTAWLTRRAARARARLASLARLAPRGGLGGRVASALLVLAITSLVYTILEPGVGWNRPTSMLLVSVIIGIGFVTYLSSGVEATMTRRIGGVSAAVRPFPAAIAVAAISVAISRLLDFRPGVMYGFVASCALLSPEEPDARRAGRIATFPTLAVLVLSVRAWLLLEPLRSWRGGSGGWLAGTLEATAVVIFVGGIEGLFIGMIPLAVTDGGKIFRWSRTVWLIISVMSAFLAWHVLLGRERTYFSGLREASSVTVLLAFIAYTVITVGLWGYFRFHHSHGEPS